MELDHAWATRPCRAAGYSRAGTDRVGSQGRCGQSVYPNGLWTETDLAQIIDQPGDIERHIETASHSVLGAVQDFVVLNTREPWPVPRYDDSTFNIPDATAGHVCRGRRGRCTSGIEHGRGPL
jgi:hypothetical protein